MFLKCPKLFTFVQTHGLSFRACEINLNAVALMLSLVEVQYNWGWKFHKLLGHFVSAFHKCWKRHNET